MTHAGRKQEPAAGRPRSACLYASDNPLPVQGHRGCSAGVQAPAGGRRVAGLPAAQGPALLLQTSNKAASERGKAAQWGCWRRVGLPALASAGGRGALHGRRHPVLYFACTPHLGGGCVACGTPEAKRPVESGTGAAVRMLLAPLMRGVWTCRCNKSEEMSPNKRVEFVHMGFKPRSPRYCIVSSGPVLTLQQGSLISRR